MFKKREVALCDEIFWSCGQAPIKWRALLAPSVLQNRSVFTGSDSVFFFLPPPVLALASAPIKNSVHCEIFRSQGRRGGAFLRALKSFKTNNTIQNRYRYRFVIKELWWYHLPQDLRIYGGSLGIFEVIPKSCTSISCFLKIYSTCNCVPKIFYLPTSFYIILFYLIFWDYPLLLLL